MPVLIGQQISFDDARLQSISYIYGRPICMMAGTEKRGPRPSVKRDVSGKHFINMHFIFIDWFYRRIPIFCRLLHAFIISTSNIRALTYCTIRFDN